MKTRVASFLSWYQVFGLFALAAVWPAVAQVNTSFPTVTIHATDSRASEGGSDGATFTVRRTGPTNSALLVFFQLGGTAANGVDYDQITGPVQISAGEFATSFTVWPVDDTLVEGDETVLAQITESPMACATCGYRIGAPSNAVVTIADNDLVGTNHPPFVQLNTPQNGEVFNAPANVVLRAFAQDDEDSYNVTVEFFEGTRSLGFGTFVGARCAIPYCPYYELTWSNVPPGGYTLTARATDSGGASSVSNPARITVLGDGVNIYATDSVATERPGPSNIPPDTATFTVRRSGDTSIGIVVFYEISGSASNGVDYQRLSGHVSIPEGASSAEIVVGPIDDNLAEGTETVMLTLRPPCPPCLFTHPQCDVPEGTNCYPIGPDNSAVAYIRDNDTGGTNQPPFVRLNEPQNGALFAAPANVTLRAFAQDAEDHYDLRVEFFEGTRSLGFGTFVATTCPAPYCPFYQLIWSNAPPGRYVLTARATDHGGATSVSDPVSITVVDSNPSAVNIYATDPVATEQPVASNIPPDTATFTVRRSGGTDVGIVVFYEVSGTASNGVDYQRLSGHVTIPEGASSAEIVVGPIDDNLVEGTETVMLTLIPPCPPCLFMNPPCEVAQGTNCYPIGPDNRAVAHIRDNDTSGTNRAPYVRLIAPQNGDVFPTPADIRLVAYAQDAEDGYSLKVEFFEGTTSLGFGTFLPGRCATCPNYVLIWSNAPPGRYILTAQATDSDGAVSLSEPVYITVFGSDASAVNIYGTDPAAAEQPAVSSIPPDTATFTVRRSGDTSSGIVVFYEIGGTASNGVDYQRLSGHVSIPEGASSAEIVVGPIDDTLVEGTETVVLTLIPPCPPCLFTPPRCLLPQGTNCYPIGRDNRAVAYIRDNDQANIMPVVSIVARDSFASEGRNFWRGDGADWACDAWNSWHVNVGGTNTATFVVRRHGPTNDNLTVNYEIGGTASNGIDYVTLSGSVTIPAGRRSAQIVVVPIDDTLAEDIETVVLKLRPSTDYALGQPARASAIIVDNDRPRPHCVLLSDRQFHLCRPATNGLCFRIEASTDLVHWTPLCTNVVTDGALHFVDPDAPSSDVRFYRAAAEPGLSPDD